VTVTGLGQVRRGGSANGSVGGGVGWLGLPLLLLHDHAALATAMTAQT
jgi:hypothetical protein